LPLRRVYTSIAFQARLVLKRYLKLIFHVFLMNKKVLVILSVILGFILLGLVISSVDLSSVFQTLQLFSFSKFLLLLGFYLLLYIISLARWGMTINAFGKTIPFFKLLSYRLSEWALGYVTPFSRLGGEPMMAYLMKKESKLKFRKGISVILINKVFDFAAGLILACIGLIVLILSYWDELTGKTIFLLIAAVVILAGIIYQFYSKTIKKEGFFTTLIEPFKKIIPHRKLHNNIKIVENVLINFFKSNRNKLIILAIISFIFQVLMLVEYKLIGTFLGMNLSFVQVLIINLFLVLSFIIPTPGSIGGMEGAMAFIFGLMGLGASRGFAFSLALRSVEITITVIGLCFAYYYSVKSVKKEVEERF
jgi:uncharacterized protein (TIRG00374 family)